MKKKSFSVAFLIIGCILAMYAISLIIPLLWAFMTSFKSRSDFVINSVIALPQKWRWDNYIKAGEVFQVYVSGENGRRAVLLGEMFLYSILYSFGCAAIVTFIPCLVAYLVQRYHFKFSGFIYNLVVVVMLIPVVGNMPSTILVLRTLGLFDSYFGLLALNAHFTGTYFIIFYGTFKGVDNGYVEAAKIDGASNTTIMFRIMFPLIRTTISTVFLLNLIAKWNDYLTPMIYWPSCPTASLGLMLYSHNRLVNSVPDQLVGSIIVVLPILVVFLCFKKYLMGNLTMGGLKG